MNPSLKQLIFIFTFVHLGCSLAASVPGLYLDKIIAWTTSGISHTQIPGGYNFTHTWRTTLPSVQSTALGLYNFKTGGGKMLNFKAELNLTTTVSTILNIQPIGPQAGIAYLAFSIVVVTANNSLVEVVSVIQSNLVKKTYFQNTFTVSSTKFTFQTSSHQVNNFIQWIASLNSITCTGTKYWIMLQLEPIVGTSQIRIPYYKDDRNSEVKMNILIVAKQLGGQPGTFYAIYSQVGSFSFSTVQGYQQYFYNDFGLNTSRFGSSTSGQRCIHGFTYLFLNCPFGVTSKVSSGLFLMNGSQVSSFSYTDAEVLRVQTMCYGICPFGQNCNNPLPTVDQVQQSGGSLTNVYIIVGVCLGFVVLIVVGIFIARNYKSSQNSRRQIVEGPVNFVGQPTTGVLIQGESLDQPQRTQVEQNNTAQAQTGNLWEGIFVVSAPTTTSETGPNPNKYKNRLWKKAGTQHIEDEPSCSICLCSWNGLETCCGHYYHIKCIVEWAKRKDECGLCRQTLAGQKHRIFCLKCNKYAVWLYFQQIQAMYLGGKVEKEAICNNYKMNQKSM